MFLAVEYLIWILASASFVKAGVIRLGVFNGDEGQPYPPSDISSYDLQNYQILLVDEPILRVTYDDDSSSHFLRESEENEPKVISNLEWKKLRRYINRQLKVPRRYWKRIVRNLNKVVKLRTATADGTVRRTPLPSFENNIDIEFLNDKGDYFASRDIIINRCRNLQFLRKLGIAYDIDYDE